MRTILLKDNETYDGLIKDGIFSKTEFKILFHVSGDNCIIKNIRVNNPKNDFDKIIKISGKNCLIEGCSFEDINVKGTVICLERKGRIRIPDRLVIKDCLFYNGKKNDGYSIMLGGNENTRGSGRCIMINNRFENFYREIFLNCIHNIILNNEFINSYTLFAKGNGNVIAFNKIDFKNNKNLKGFNIQNDKQHIKNNLFMNIPTTSITLMEINNCNIKDNVFINCEECLNIDKQKNTVVMSNKFIKCKNVFSDKLFDKDDLKFVKNSIGGEFKTDIKKFELSEYVDLASKILDYVEGEEKKQEVKKEKEKTDVEKMIIELSKNINITAKMSELNRIQKDFSKNLLEYRLLMEEFRNFL